MKKNKKKIIDFVQEEHNKDFATKNEKTMRTYQP